MCIPFGRNAGSNPRPRGDRGQTKLDSCALQEDALPVHLIDVLSHADLYIQAAYHVLRGMYAWIRSGNFPTSARVEYTCMHQREEGLFGNPELFGKADVHNEHVLSSQSAL